MKRPAPLVPLILLVLSCSGGSPAGHRDVLASTDSEEAVLALPDETDPLDNGRTIDEGPGTPDVTLPTKDIEEFADTPDLPPWNEDVTLPPDTGQDMGSDAPEDFGPACDNPFVPQGPTEEWRHVSTSLFTITQGAANHRGQDVVVNPGSQAVLIGKFAYGVFDKDLKDEWVEVWFQPEPPCGPWIKLGQDLTSEDGEFGSTFGIEDDGGRIFFTLNAGDVPGPGVYPVVMLVKGDHSLARFHLFVLKPGRQVVVTDIDGTLTTSDFQLVSELFVELFNGTYVPAMYPDADTAMRLYREKGYDHLYMTGRPDWLKSVTVKWLDAKGFPPGIVHLTDTNAQALPTAGGVQAYKRDFLKFLMGSRAIVFPYAYGNATTDIGAYGDAGIAKDHTFIIGANGGQEGTQAIPTYTDHLPYVQGVPQAVQP